jgi:NitT/TauT family transport system substrate-binding protein
VGRAARTGRRVGDEDVISRRSVIAGATATGLGIALGSRARAQALREIVSAEPVHSTGYVPLYLAIDRGFFAKRGMDVKMLTASNGAHVAALISGQVWGDIGGPESDAMANVGKADPLISICNVVNRANVYIVAKKGTAPKSSATADQAAFFRGKKLAFDRYGGTPDVLGRWYLAKIGLDPEKDVTIINNGDTNSTLPMMKGGAADIALVIEPLITLGKEQGAWDEPFFGFPSLGDYSYSVISVRKSTIASDPATVQAFVDAMIDALKLTAADHAAVAEVSRKEFPTMSETAIKGTVDRSFADNLWSKDGVISPQGYALDMEVVAKSGEFTKPAPFAGVVDMQFVMKNRRTTA